MVTTRSSQGSSSPAAGEKRAASVTSADSQPSKRGKTTAKSPKREQQMSIEESMAGIEDNSKVDEQINGNGEEEKATESHQEDAGDKGEDNPEKDGRVETQNGAKGDDDRGEKNEENAFNEVKSDEADVQKAASKEQDAKTSDITRDNQSVVEDEKRETKIPSSILEKGLIYFFYRGRVGIEDPQGIEDVARSYIVLRPLPLGAALGDGPLEDLGTSRLLALPKKMLPKSKKDRFLVFVEKPKATIKELRDSFEHNDYSTKTSGTSHVPSATPFAEGVYAITSSGRDSHLAYEITAPKIGELQKDLGVNEKGSYVLSVKNPKAPGPSYASLDNPAKYPEEIQSKFRDLRWLPLEPELLNYENSQVLIIGEGQGVLGRAVEGLSKDQKDDSKDEPEEELGRLKEEDHSRVEHLQESDPVFADLGMSSKEYSKMQSSW